MTTPYIPAGVARCAHCGELVGYINVMYHPHGQPPRPTIDYFDDAWHTPDCSHFSADCLNGPECPCPCCTGQCLACRIERARER